MRLSSAVATLPVALLAGALLTACSGRSDADAPAGWVADEYRAGGDGYVDASDAPTEVADEIEGHTPAKDRVTSGDAVFLRYRDDVVAVTATQGRGGSFIEIEDYQRARTRWHSQIGTRWPADGADGTDADSADSGGDDGSGRRLRR